MICSNTNFCNRYVHLPFLLLILQKMIKNINHTCSAKLFMSSLPVFVRPLCKYAMKVHTAILAKLSFYGCHVVLYATDRVTHKLNGLIYTAVGIMRSHKFLFHFYHNLTFLFAVVVVARIVKG